MVNDYPGIHLTPTNYFADREFANNVVALGDSLIVMQPVLYQIEHRGKIRSRSQHCQNKIPSTLLGLAS